MFLKIGVMQLQLKSLKDSCEIVDFSTKVAGCNFTKNEILQRFFSSIWKCTSVQQLHYTTVCRIFIFAELSMAAYKESKYIKVYLYSLYGNV